MMKNGYLVFSIFVIFLIVSSGCINMQMTYQVKVNTDTSVENPKISLTLDRAGYNLLKLSATGQGYSSVRELIQANISKTFDSNDIDYDEEWNQDTGKVTITIERKGKFYPSADSKISIIKKENLIGYRDLTYYTEQQPDSTNQYYDQQQSEALANYMLSGITLNYYIEMPGKIVNTSANVVKDNKAEWHLTGLEISKTQIAAVSEVPSVSGFSSVIAIVSLLLLCIYSRKKSRDNN